MVAAFLLYRELQIAPSDQSVSNSTYRKYQNTQANITFTYPISLGAAREELLEPENNNLVSSGKALKITFSATNDVWLIAATQDFSMFKENAYVGDGRITTSSCLRPGIVDDDGNGCSVRTIRGNDVLVRAEYFADEGVYNLLRTFSLDLSAGLYHGLKIIQGFSSVYDAVNASATDTEREKLLQQYAQELLSGISPTQELSMQLQNVDRIVRSVSFDKQE